MRPELASEANVHVLVLLQLLLVVIAHELLQGLLKGADAIARVAEQLAVHIGIVALQVLHVHLQAQAVIVDILLGQECPDFVRIFAIAVIIIKKVSKIALEGKALLCLFIHAWNRCYY